LIDIIGSPSSNARAVYFAFLDMGIDCKIVKEATEISNSKKIVLPGVGAFGALSKFLHDSKLYEPLQLRIAEGAKMLGICLGMQLLSESSEESPEYKGLGIFKNRCKKFEGDDLRVPHTGWDQVSVNSQHELLRGLSLDFSAFFSHSYYFPVNKNCSLGITEYGVEFSSIVVKDNVVGLQFHPERSQSNGRKILSNFADWK
jgi:imidazole glycerol phosphate synthase glutamine amidotransferase subunit